MTGPLLEARDLRKAYRRRPVLRGASMTLARGELVGIVGENGCGKSTLLRILVGLVSRDGGELSIAGRLGYCPQQAAVFGRLTVRENFTYFATAYGLGNWEPAMEALLERYRFRATLDQLTSEVSGGTRQKLNLALALLASPDIVLLDEPYSGLDWEAYVAFWQHAEQLRDAGCGILVVSHFMYDRSRFDRILNLEGGQLECGSAT
jgi:ABC-type multidrug transport system ATPase subunit